MTGVGMGTDIVGDRLNDIHICHAEKPLRHGPDAATLQEMRQMLTQTSA